METVKLPKWKESPLLPSAFQLGEFVHVSIGEASFRFAHGNVLRHGKVIKVHFSSGKVCYDLEFTIAIDNANKKRYTTRIHNVDGALCEPVDTDNVRTDDQNSLYDSVLWSIEKSLEEIGNFSFQRTNFSDAEWNRILHNLHKDLGESPFNHGGWHNSNEIIFQLNEDGISSDKLIDIDGNRKIFRVGWYVANEKQWYYYHEENDQPIDQKNMKWAELPLERN